MKRILLLISFLVAFLTTASAQRFLDFYRNGSVVQSISVSDIDQLRINKDDKTGRTVDIYREGVKYQSYNVTSIDSVKVYRPYEEPLVYLGIVGFNQEIYEKPFGVLANSTENTWENFVSNLTSKSATILYYAADHALGLLADADFKTRLTSVNLITFTDGLDQGSLMLNSQYSTEKAYLDAVSNRINSTKVNGMPITAYSLGLRGKDVTDYDQFKYNLQKLASSDDKATEVQSIYDVRSRLQEIAEQIINVNTTQNVSLKIPGPGNGTRVRFVFDGKAPEKSALYIDGVFNISTMSLSSVTYQGFNTTSGRVVQGIRDGIFVTFPFTGLQLTDGNGRFSTSSLKQYNRPSGSSLWQVNSEFSPNSDVKTTTTHHGCAILLVLDCSSSLGSDFSSMKSYVNDFISKIADNSIDFTIAAPKEVSANIREMNNKLVVDMSWMATRNAQFYTVYRSGSSSGTYSVVADSVATTEWTDTAPMSGYNYYKVVAHGFGLSSSQSSYASVNFILEPPTNLMASAENSNDKLQISLSWTASQFAQSYTVYRSDSKNGNYEVIARNVTSTSWVDSSPLRGMSFYKVTALGYGLTSDYSNVILYNTTPGFFKVNGVEFKMIPVAGGSFMMGNNNGNSDERPVHQVTLSDFAIGETEVTQELWEAVMGANPSYFKGTKLPVERVTWNNCQTFITKLNALTGQQFRLPTEAEWEYAARGGNQSIGYTYSGSSNIRDVAWYSSNSGSSSKTHEVATKAPNELGIYDMNGNVWEWCQDWYGSYSSGSQTNPQGPSSGSERVYRGGSWYSLATECRCANRDHGSPSSADYSPGFRLAL